MSTMIFSMQLVQDSDPDWEHVPDQDPLSCFFLKTKVDNLRTLLIWIRALHQFLAFPLCVLLCFKRVSNVTYSLSQTSMYFRTKGRLDRISQQSFSTVGSSFSCHQRLLISPPPFIISNKTRKQENTICLLLITAGFRWANMFVLIVPSVCRLIITREWLLTELNDIHLDTVHKSTYT